MKRKRRILRFYHLLENFINVLLVLNLVATLLLTTAWVRQHWGRALDIFCNISIIIFILEILIRILLRPNAADIKSFFRRNGHWNHWNMFDLTVTGVSALSLFGSVASLVGIRTLRLLKLFSTSKMLLRNRQLHDITEAVVAAIPPIMGAGLYILFITTLYAIVGVSLYREASPVYFGTLGDTYLTLFQLMLFDDWGQIIRPLLATHPWAWIYAVSFTLVASCILLNLIVGYIVDSIQHIRISNELRSQHGIMHESDKLQEQLERFEREFKRWQEKQKDMSVSRHRGKQHRPRQNREES